MPFSLDDQLTKVADTATAQQIATTLYKNISACSAWRWATASRTTCNRRTAEAARMDLDKAMSISARGMDVETTRLRIIAENLANQEQHRLHAGRRRLSAQDPHVREQHGPKRLGVTTVQVKRIGTDASEQRTRYDPSNPAANKDGYVKQPNVNSFVEVMDIA